jgi:hypothetical protein
MSRMAIVVLSGPDVPGRASAGLHVAKRIADARASNGIEVVEVFLFADGIKILGQPDSELGRLVRELIEAGLVVGGCTNQLKNGNLEEAAGVIGVRAEFARDTFARYAREGYTVLTF